MLLAVVGVGVALGAAPSARPGLAQKLSNAMSPSTPGALRAFYVYDALKSIPDEADMALAALLATRPEAVRELREQLLTDLPVVLPALERRVWQEAAAFQSAPRARAPTSAGEAALPPPPPPGAAAPAVTTATPFGLRAPFELPALPGFERPPTLDMSRLQAELQELLVSPPSLDTVLGELNEVQSAIWGDAPRNAPGTPRFAVLRSRDEGNSGAYTEGALAYEIRRYKPYAIARTALSGDADKVRSGAAAGAALDRLAAYLAGRNARNETFQFGAPIELALATDGSTGVPLPGGRATIAVPLGRNASLGAAVAGLAQPESADVALTMRPARVVAVARFSGFATLGAVGRAHKALLAQLRADGTRTLPHREVDVLLHNPPYTLPHLRTNEVLVPVDYLTPEARARRETGAMRLAVEEFDH
ncbi:hypothetical protein KFE25_002435 [Diacronema lutheri]|uniref:Uncharacterized protein n=1 Tax=Diacronema lutheri TaxID=2081491 RepID=A0A8J5X570_DIALT|nr:hypothetical protein KFE25_002435 [Diacronema lutheri]